MALTSDAEVREIIDASSDTKTAPFIRAAHNLLNRLATTCTGFSSLPDELRKDVETWLAAHFMAIRDGQYSSESNAGASGTRQGQTAMHLDMTYWGQTAMTLDTSGCLAKLNQEMKAGFKQKASMTWLGKTVAEKLTFEDRN